jgi:hypothetical protein
MPTYTLHFNEFRANGALRLTIQDAVAGAGIISVM